MKRILLFTIFTCFYLGSIGQELHYYVQKTRYKADVTDLSSVKNYDFIGHAYIDKTNSGVIDYNLLKQRIEVLYPEQDASTTLVLNLENKIYANLKSKNKNLRQKSVAQFVKLVKFVKELRPNLKVGVYGVPFRFNYDFQKKANHLGDLRPLFKTVDFLAPDLYVSFGKTEQSEQNFIRVVKENLDLYVSAAKLENKPIKVFVWYKIHPYNKKFGGTNVDSERMDVLISTIREKQKEYRKLDGVLWWDSWQTNNQRSKNELSSRFLKYNTKGLK